MVRLTIFIEGGSNSDIIQTANNNAVFRENFHQLFSQQFAENEFDLVIQPIGSITRARDYLQKIVTENLDALLLIDLDAPRSERGNRINDNYGNLETAKLFFMIQEMEAWILSQPDRIDEFGQIENLIRKRPNENIVDNTLLKDIHPENISNPSNKLETILRQYFDDEKIRRGRIRRTGKKYSKMKDGPKLIGLLSLEELSNTFDEVERILDYIMSVNG